MSNYLCGVTLSSKVKGDVQKVGFYDINQKIHHQVNVIKNKQIKVFNVSISKSKYSINVNRIFNLELDSFESSYAFIFPIKDDMFLKIKDCNELNSINYRNIAKDFGLEEWLV